MRKYPMGINSYSNREDIGHLNERCLRTALEAIKTVVNKWQICRLVDCESVSSIHLLSATRPELAIDACWCSSANNAED
jgi:hypothetical protein